MDIMSFNESINNIERSLMVKEGRTLIYHESVEIFNESVVDGLKKIASTIKELIKKFFEWLRGIGGKIRDLFVRKKKELQNKSDDDSKKSDDDDSKKYSGHEYNTQGSSDSDSNDYEQDKQDKDKKDRKDNMTQDKKDREDDDARIKKQQWDHQTNDRLANNLLSQITKAFNGYKGLVKDTGTACKMDYTSAIKNMSSYRDKDDAEGKTNAAAFEKQQSEIYGKEDNLKDAFESIEHAFRRKTAGGCSKVVGDKMLTSLDSLYKEINSFINSQTSTYLKFIYDSCDKIAALAEKYMYANAEDKAKGLGDLGLYNIQHLFARVSSTITTTSVKLVATTTKAINMI